MENTYPPIIEDIFLGPQTLLLRKWKQFLISYQNEEILDFLLEEILENACYACTLENKEPYIIDCGSNIGISILYFKERFPNSTIVAFEPNYSTAEVLRRNVLLNKLHDVTVIPSALSGKSGYISLYTNTSDEPDSIGDTTCGELRSTDTAGERLVLSEQLSEYITKDVDLLKLDVEGCELEVLYDLEKSSKLRYVKKMFIELHAPLEEMPQRQQQLELLLQNNNFILAITNDAVTGENKDMLDEWSSRTGIAVQVYFCESVVFITENPFISDIVSAQWIDAISKEVNTERTELLSKVLQPWIDDGRVDTVIDIGCGTGYCAQLIPPEKKYIGIDSSRALIGYAHENFSGDNREFIHADAYHIPLSNNSVSAAFSFGVLFHIQYLAIFFAEAYRILEEGGKVIIFTASPDTYDRWVSDYLHYTNEKGRVAGPIRLPRGTLDHNIFYLHTVDEIVTSMKNAGFRSINISRESSDSVWMVLEAKK